MNLRKDKKIKEIIKKLIDDPPKSTKELTLLDGFKIKSLIVCIWCLSYISQAWGFCPHCGKKSKKLTVIQRKKALYKMIETKFIEYTKNKS